MTVYQVSSVIFEMALRCPFGYAQASLGEQAWTWTSCWVGLLSSQSTAYIWVSGAPSLPSMSQA